MRAYGAGVRPESVIWLNAPTAPTQRYAGAKPTSSICGVSLPSHTTAYTAKKRVAGAPAIPVAEAPSRPPTCTPSTCACGVDKHCDVITHKLSRPARDVQDGGHNTALQSAESRTLEYQSPISTTSKQVSVGGLEQNGQPEHDMDATEREASPYRQTSQRAEGGKAGKVASPARSSRSVPPPAAAGPDFEKIRKVCEHGKYERENLDLRPTTFAQYKRDNWPAPELEVFPPQLVRIYDTVRATGLPNPMAARIPVPTSLNLEAWRDCIEEIGGRPHVLDFLTYGFPLGYVGPTSDSVEVGNHPSAEDYPADIALFLKKEKEKGGLLGPFTCPPFVPWCHVSPLMSRPKSHSSERRVITDMTFPPEVSVNAFVIENGVYGIEMDQSLPTVDNLVQHIRHMPQGVFLATMDIARAYKNFNTDPLDWPLLSLAWRGQYFCDVTIPFGARASSFHMQTIAGVIVDILAVRGIKSYMYLDDLILVSPNREKANSDFEVARNLLRDLNLPEAVDKAQPPATKVKWLGVNIDTQEMTLSIPQDKINEVLEKVSKFTKAKSMTKRQLQSILGQLLHVAKCVRPARLFVSRLLDKLRETKGLHLNVNADMRADFRWFQEFCAQWNGVSYMAAVTPTRHIYVDACLSGIGASDGAAAYAGQVAPVEDGACNITELETVNIVVALHTFLTHRDAGSHVQIHCDNKAAVQVLQSGKGRNKVLLDCARAAWMLQAVLDVHISYVHVPGKDNEIADRLSRAHLSRRDHLLLSPILEKHCLHVIEPCLYVFHNMSAPVLSRSGYCIVTGQGYSKAATGSSAGDMGQPGLQRGDIHRVRQTGTVRLHGTRPLHDLRLHRIPGAIHTSACHHQEQDLPRAHFHQDGQRDHDRDQPPIRGQGNRGPDAQQRVRAEDQGCRQYGDFKVGDSRYTSDSTGSGRESGYSPPVLWGAAPIRSGAPGSISVRPSATPHQGRPSDLDSLPKTPDKMGKEHATGGRTASGYTLGCPRVDHVPRRCNAGAFRPHPDSLFHRPTLSVQGVRGPNPHDYAEKGMGRGSGGSWRRPTETIPTQPQQLPRPTLKAVETLKFRDWADGNRTHFANILQKTLTLALTALLSTQFTYKILLYLSYFPHPPPLFISHPHTLGSFGP